MIIGLTGYKQSGKDTTANILCEEFGFERMAFGDALRAMARAINPLLWKENGEIWRYCDLLSTLGYEDAKKIQSVREFLQTLGTEAVRDVLGPQTWINALSRRIAESMYAAAPKHPNIVITDVRFPNEAKMVVDMKGWLWKIVRPGQDNNDPHPSEAHIADMNTDFTLVNDSTIDNLKMLVRRNIGEMLHP